MVEHIGWPDDATRDAVLEGLAQLDDDQANEASTDPDVIATLAVAETTAALMRADTGPWDADASTVDPAQPTGTD
jgi:hypothetical protein